MINNPNNPLPAGGQTPPGGDPPGQTPPQPTPGQTPPAPQQKTSLNDLPQDIQDLVRGLRREAKESREALEAKIKAEEDAAQAILKKQGEFQQLAEKHEARVKELEPIASSYAALAEQVNAQIEAEIKDWPKEVTIFDPGHDAPIESRLEWRNKSRPLIDKLQTTARGALPGNRPNPTPGGQPSREEMISRNIADLKKARTYGI
jgi:hypothetical protein